MIIWVTDCHTLDEQVNSTVYYTETGLLHTNLPIRIIQLSQLLSLFALSFRIYPQIFYLPRPNRVSIQRERETFIVTINSGLFVSFFPRVKVFQQKKTSRSINSFLEFFKNSITLLSILDIIIIVIARNSEKPFLRVPLLDRSVHEFHERRKRFVYTRAIPPRFITTLKRGVGEGI